MDLDFDLYEFTRLSTLYLASTPFRSPTLTFHETSASKSHRMSFSDVSHHSEMRRLGVFKSCPDL